MVKNYGEIFPPPLKLLVVMDEAYVCVPYNTTGRLWTLCKFLRNVAYGSKIVIIRKGLNLVLAMPFDSDPLDHTYTYGTSDPQKLFAL